MEERKLSKRSYMTVVESEKCKSTPRLTREGSIWTQHQHFTLRHKHLKGSNRPEGWFHQMWGGADLTVDVRWLWTNDLGYFAPEVSFRPSTDGLKTVAKVGKALHSIRNAPEEGPELLTNTLKATVVEYVDDRKEGCWDDYRPLRVPGEPAMVTIARYAASKG